MFLNPDRKRIFLDLLSIDFLFYCYSQLDIYQIVKRYRTFANTATEIKLLLLLLLLLLRLNHYLYGFVKTTSTQWLNSCLSFSEESHLLPIFPVLPSYLSASSIIHCQAVPLPFGDLMFDKKSKLNIACDEKSSQGTSSSHSKESPFDTVT